VTDFGSSDIITDESYIQYLETVISGDRMIFLRDDGEVVILNKKSWHRNEETGIWYSNLYSIQDRPRYSWGRHNSFPLSSASASKYYVKDEHGWYVESDVKADSNTTLPDVLKSARESALVLLPENSIPHTNFHLSGHKSVNINDLDLDDCDYSLNDDKDDDGIDLGDVLDDNDVLYFRWQGDEFVQCYEEESEIEISVKEYYEGWDTTNPDKQIEFD
jgi:hypothetical protein